MIFKLADLAKKEERWIFGRSRAQVCERHMTSPLVLTHPEVASLGLIQETHSAGVVI